MFSDKPREIRKIIWSKIIGKTWLVMSPLSQRSETLLSRQSPHANFSDEPTITKKKFVTESTTTRQKFLLMNQLLQT